MEVFLDLYSQLNLPIDETSIMDTHDPTQLRLAMLANRSKRRLEHVQVAQHVYSEYQDLIGDENIQKLKEQIKDSLSVFQLIRNNYSVIRAYLERQANSQNEMLPIIAEVHDDIRLFFSRVSSIVSRLNMTLEGLRTFNRSQVVSAQQDLERSLTLLTNSTSLIISYSVALEKFAQEIKKRSLSMQL